MSFAVSSTAVRRGLSRGRTRLWEAWREAIGVLGVLVETVAQSIKIVQQIQEPDLVAWAPSSLAPAGHLFQAIRKRIAVNINEICRQQRLALARERPTMAISGKLPSR